MESNKLELTEQKAAFFTVFTAKNHQPVSKRLTLMLDGSIQKKSLAYNLSKAIAETFKATPTEFYAGLPELKCSQALAFGLMKHGRESAHIVTKNDSANGFCFREAINRSGQYFEYATLAGVLMCDVDDPNFPLETLQQILSDIDTEFATTPAVTRPSTSSCIYNCVTGEELRGVNGFRLYLFIDNATLIPELVTLKGTFLVRWVWSFCN